LPGLFSFPYRSCSLYVLTIYKIHIVCRCGHKATIPLDDIPGVDKIDDVRREQILVRARCMVCGRRGAVDFRQLWATPLPPPSANG
jgi:hypothetical protein